MRTLDHPRTATWPLEVRRQLGGGEEYIYAQLMGLHLPPSHPCSSTSSCANLLMDHCERWRSHRDWNEHTPNGRSGKRGPHPNSRTPDRISRFPGCLYSLSPCWTIDRSCRSHPSRPASSSRSESPRFVRARSEPRRGLVLPRSASEARQATPE